jgi:hypothetical protein
MKRLQRGITYVMLVGIISASGAALTAVGSYSSMAICTDEIARLEAEDKAKVAANPTAKTVEVYRQCQRKT